MDKEQEEQLQRYLAWVNTEGDREGPVRLTTLLQPHQQARIEWVRQNTKGSIAEVGCSWGYVLGVVKGHVGVDKEPMNIALAKSLQPDKVWLEGDARALDLLDNSFDTIILAEILEHLAWPDGVESALVEASRVSRKRILITLPDGQTSEEAKSFKHQYLADKRHIDDIVDRLRDYGFNSVVEHRHGFVLIRSDEEGSSDAGE